MVLGTREVRKKINVNESLKKENVKTCRKKMKEDGKLWIKYFVFKTKLEPVEHWAENKENRNCSKGIELGKKRGRSMREYLYIYLKNRRNI